MLSGTHQKGELGRLQVLTRATELGWISSIPTVESRYDVVLDNGTRLYRVQVKFSGEGSGDFIEVDLRAECHNNGYTKVYAEDEVDVVIVYSSLTKKCYWVPPDVFAKKTCLTFRLTPLKRNRKKGVRFAVDYEW
jgi:hypothetical protein